MPRTDRMRATNRFRILAGLSVLMLGWAVPAIAQTMPEPVAPGESRVPAGRPEMARWEASR
jgi:hypothetical protein